MNKNEMLITFKTLDHRIFQLEVDEDETVSDIKQRLDHEIIRENLCTLVYCGKIMRDERLLSYYNISQKHFVILIVTKPASDIAPSEDVIQSGIQKEEAEISLPAIDDSKTI